MNWLIVRDNIVIGTQESNFEKVPPGFLPAGRYPSDVSIGWVYDSETDTFSKPTETENTETWKLTHKQFLDLFRPEELIQIDIAKESDNQIRLANIYFERALSIDLMEVLTVNYLNYLEAVGYLGEGRASEILNARPERREWNLI